MFREFRTISSLHSDLHSYTFPTITYILIHFLQALTYSYLSYKRLHTMLTNIVRITYEHLTNLPKSAHPRIWDTTKMLSRDLDYKVLFCSPKIYLYHLCSISYHPIQPIFFVCKRVRHLRLHRWNSMGVIPRMMYMPWEKSLIFSMDMNSSS